MAISRETLKAIIRDYHGFEMSDEELDLVRPELESYMNDIEKLRDFDLSDVMSARLMRAQEGGESR